MGYNREKKQRWLRDTRVSTTYSIPSLYVLGHLQSLEVLRIGPPGGSHFDFPDDDHPIAFMAYTYILLEII